MVTTGACQTVQQQHLDPLLSPLGMRICAACMLLDIALQQSIVHQALNVLVAHGHAAHTHINW